MIKQLPEDSRTVAEMNGGPEHRGWTLDRYMLAKIIDAINMNTYAFVRTNSKKKPKEPKSVPTPGDKKRRKESTKNNPFALKMNSLFEELKQKET